MRAIKAAPSKTEQAEMKGKASALLKQAEAFKKQKSDARIEVNLPIRSRTPVSSSSGTVSSSGRSASTNATSASRGSTMGSSSSSVGKTRVPRSRREMTRGEQILLMRGSKLNGCKFPPWGATPNVQDFVLEQGAELFT